MILNVNVIQDKKCIAAAAIKIIIEMMKNIMSVIDVPYLCSCPTHKYLISAEIYEKIMNINISLSQMHFGYMNQRIRHLQGQNDPISRTFSNKRSFTSTNALVRKQNGLILTLSLSFKYTRLEASFHRPQFQF